MRIAVVMALCGLLLAGPAQAGPQDKPKSSQRQSGSTRFDEEFTKGGTKEIERFCAEKVAQTLPLSAIPVASLDLGQITLHVEDGYYTVLLSLARPQGEMKSLYWSADTLDEVTTFIKLLQEGTLGAVKVNAYASEFRTDTDKKLNDAELASCAREQVKDLLAPCKDCEIVEWVFKGKN